MKAKEVNFRSLYHRPIFLKYNSNIRNVMLGIFARIPDMSNGILTYGYIDHECGFTFEFLCTAYADKEANIACMDGIDNATVKFRMESVSDCEILPAVGIRTERYQSKIDIINDGYKCTEGVQETRYITGLDDSRNEDYPDDVLVYLLNDTCRPEGCWVRCEGVTENSIVGVLLNEPNQRFGVHMWDKIYFQLLKEDSGEIKCIAVFDSQ